MQSKPVHGFVVTAKGDGTRRPFFVGGPNKASGLQSNMLITTTLLPMPCSVLRSARCLGGALLVGATLAMPAAAQDRQVYRCPGNLYTDQITQREAAERGCKTLEGAPVTVIQSTTPRAAVPRPAASGAELSGGASPSARVNPAEQRARDSDARRILEAELRQEEERLAQLQKEYNNGEPERRGEERNYQKYLDRVASLKASIARTEANIAGLKRELAKLS